MKYIIALLILASCAKFEQDMQTPTGQTIEHIAEDVVETVVKDEFGVTIAL